MSKKILILGAGRGHLGLIKTAKEMGLYTIVVGLPGNYPCIPLADKFCIADISKPEEVLAVAMKEQVDGAIICASDTGLMSIGLISDKLELHGLSYESAALSQDKFLMKKALVEHGVQTAKFVTVSSFDDFVLRSSHLSYPLMIKATDLQGSRGIYKVYTQDEARDALVKVFSLTHRSYCVVEEFIEGIEFGAQAFISNGKVKFVLPHGDEVFDTGHTKIPIGHSMPLATGDSDFLSKVTLQVERAIEALGLDNCAVNVDLIDCDGNIFVIELSGRSGANCLAELTSIHLGFDYYKLMLLNSLGKEIDSIIEQLNSKNRKTCISKMLYAPMAGTLKSLEFPHSETIAIDFFVKPGDELRQISSSNDAIGQIIVGANSLEQCSQAIKEIESQISITIR